MVIGPYIADFACLAERLIVEVDGSQHGDDEGLRRDDVRTRWLQSEGYRVIRFWNNDVMSRTDAVLETIHDIITVTPPRLPAAGDPPPQGEGKNTPSHSRDMVLSESFKIRSALFKQRAQGKPDACCTRGLVRKKCMLLAHTSIQVKRRQSGLPCAMV